jgi:uncharacterized protein YjbI with pentapeptide repeats
MRGAGLGPANFRFCDFENVDFGELDIRDGRVRIRADLNGALFHGCNLAGAKLRDEQMRQAEFRQCSR